MNSEDLRNIYENVHKMYKYRGLEGKSDPETFEKNYKFNLFHIETAGENVVVFCHTELISKLQDFRKLVQNIADSKIDLNNYKCIIFISETPLNNNIAKQMSNILKTHLYENSKIKNKINTIHTIEALNFDYFVAELPKGPYCSKHTILNDNEIEVVLNDVKCVKKNLPRIPVSDPMIVWLGGKPGNVVKIESVSDTVGMSITYRLVTP